MKESGGKIVYFLISVKSLAKHSKLIGKKFGKLTIKSIAGKNKWGAVLYNCICDCGVMCVSFKTSLISRMCKSCGCLHAESASKSNQTHGLSKLPEYEIWKAMKARCYNPNHKGFHNYGGRGICVCDRWLDSFETFYSDMGPRSDKVLTVERENNDGDYGPENCHWDTRKVQARNRRNNKVFTFNGQTKCITEWAEELNVSQFTLYSRISRGRTPYGEILDVSKRKLKV